MHLWRISTLLCLFMLLATVSIQATESEAGSGILEQHFSLNYHPLSTRQYPYVAYPFSDPGHRQRSIPASAHLSSMQTMASGQEVSRPGRSPKAAFFLSLLLPGAGQYYVQAPQKAKLFLGIESALWALLLGFRTYGSWREADYGSFAMEYAGVDPTDQSDEYLDDLGFYASAFEYNRYARRERGPQATLYSGNNAWEWDSEASRLEYKALRKSSLQARSRATYVLGGLLLHRIFSAIHAVRLAHAWNENTATQEKHIQFYVELEENEPTLRLTLFNNF